jgi:membrane protein YqaA with SNARE-associated domain
VNSILIDFWVQTFAGIVGGFVGVWLALIMDRRRQARAEAVREQELQQQYARARHTVMGSVVKNSNETSRLRIRIDERGI